MPTEFVVRVQLNEEDDRWAYTIDGIAPDDMMYPLIVGGLDEFGQEQSGPWNYQAGSLLQEIMDAAADEITNYLSRD